MHAHYFLLAIENITANTYQTINPGLFVTNQSLHVQEEEHNVYPYTIINSMIGYVGLKKQTVCIYFGLRRP